MESTARLADSAKSIEWLATGAGAGGIACGFMVASSKGTYNKVRLKTDVNDNKCYYGREGGNRFWQRTGNRHLLERQQIDNLGDHSRDSFVGVRYLLRD